MSVVRVIEWSTRVDRGETNQASSILSRIQRSSYTLPFAATRNCRSMKLRAVLVCGALVSSCRQYRFHSEWSTRFGFITLQCQGRCGRFVLAGTEKPYPGCHSKSGPGAISRSSCRRKCSSPQRSAHVSAVGVEGVYSPAEKGSQLRSVGVMMAQWSMLL